MMAQYRIRAVTACLLLGILAWCAQALALSVTFPGPGSTNNGTVAIGTPVSIGSNSVNSGTTLVITTTANAPAGSVIVVGCGANSAFTTVSMADGTNTYTTAIKDGGNSNVLSNSGVLGAQLNSGASITVTTGATFTDGWCAAAYVTGLSTATPDKTVSAVAITVTTATLTQANEIVFGLALAYNSGVTPGTISMTSGFTILAHIEGHGTDVESNALAYKIVAATTAVTFSWTATVTSAITNAATYKGN